VLLEWEVPLESQACLESQVQWVLRVLLVSLDPKEKVELLGHRDHQAPKVSQGFKASQESQVSLVK
jgi:hypothetical protein